MHPGAIAILVAMAEQEQRHRRILEATGQSADIEHRQEVVQMQDRANSRAFWSDICGQGLGAVIAALCVGGAIYCAYARLEWYYIAAFLGLPVGAIIKAIRDRIGGSPNP